MLSRSQMMRAAIKVVLLSMLVATAANAWSSSRQWAAFRQALFQELQPVELPTCTLERFGEPADGGYLICGNLLEGTQAAYSYGIAGFDQWGCDVAARLKTTTHQYDCFDTTRPVCPAAVLTFHEECVGARTETVDALAFDTVERQVARNGDAGKRLIVKIDVEGAEWESLLAVSDAQLGRIDQLAIEFHGLPDPQALQVVRRLKQFFHVASLHFNNNSCRPFLDPFPAWAFEVLFVNRRLASVAVEDHGVPAPSSLHTPTNPDLPDCQTTS